MHTLHFIALLIFIPLAEEQILPTNVQQTRQRLLGISRNRYAPANSWWPYLPSQRFLRNYYPSYNQMIGNSVVPVRAATVALEPMAGGEAAAAAAANLSPQVMKEARAALASGTDIADIGVLQNYPKQHLDQLEERLTDPALSISPLSGTSVNRNMVGNIRHRNAQGNIWREKKVNQMSRMYNLVRNPFPNGKRSNSNIFDTTSNVARSPVSKTGSQPATNSPPQISVPQMMSNVNREAHIREGKTSNTVDPNVVSLLKELSRLWNKRRSQAPTGFNEANNVFNQIDTIVRTLSPLSKRMIMPIISRFKLSQNTQDNLAQTSISSPRDNTVQGINKIEHVVSKTTSSAPTEIKDVINPAVQGTATRSTDLISGEHSTGSTISTVSQTTQLERPLSSSNIADTKLGLQPSGKTLSSIPLSVNTADINQLSLLKSNSPADSMSDTARNLPSIDPESSTNRESNLALSPSSSNMFRNALARSMPFNVVNSMANLNDIQVPLYPVEATLDGNRIVNVAGKSVSSPTQESQPTSSISSSQFSSTVKVGDSPSTIAHSPLQTESLPRVDHAQNSAMALHTLSNEQSRGASSTNYTVSKINNVQLTDVINKPDMSSTLLYAQPSGAVSTGKSKSTVFIKQSSTMNNANTSPSPSAAALTNPSKIMHTRASLITVSTTQSTDGDNISNSLTKANQAPASKMTTTDNSVRTGSVSTVVTNTTLASSSSTVTGTHIRNSLSVPPTNTASSTGQNLEDGRRSSTKHSQADPTSLRLMKHKSVQDTWEAFSKSLKNMVAYGNLLLQLTGNMANIQLPTQG